MKLTIVATLFLSLGITGGVHAAEPPDSAPPQSDPAPSPPPASNPQPPPTATPEPATPPVPAAPVTTTPTPATPVRTDAEALRRSLTAYLSAKTGKEMTAALDALRNAGDPAVLAVIDRYRSEVNAPAPKREILNRLDTALIKIGKVTLVPVVAVFRSPTESVALRAEMARVLGRLQGYRSVFALVEVLANTLEKNPAPLAARILEVLGDLSDPRPYPSVERALLHEDPSVRFAAATALGKLQDPAAFPGLIKALDDPDLAVRAAANRALIRLSGTDPGYAADTADAQRKAMIDKWNTWWLLNRDRLKPPPDPLTAELWKQADDVLAFALGSAPLKGYTKPLRFPLPHVPVSEPVLLSTVNLPNGIVPVVVGRRVVLRAPETLFPIPAGGYWRFDAPNVEENHGDLSLSYLVSGRKAWTAVFKYTLDKDGWKIEDVTASEGQETSPVPPSPSPPPTNAPPAPGKPAPDSPPASDTPAPDAGPAQGGTPPAPGAKPADGEARAGSP